MSKRRENNFSFSIKQEVFNKADGRCWYCGVPMTSPKTYFSDLRAFTVDHLENFGGDDISNLVPACKDCNSRKKQRSLEQFRESQSIRFGSIFSRAQREYWDESGVTLPADEPFVFYFEREGLEP